MKYVITESKLNSAIYEYIDELFHNGYDIRMEEAEDEDGNPIEYAYDFIQDNGDYGFLFTWTGKEYYKTIYAQGDITKFEYERISSESPTSEILDKDAIVSLNGYFGDLWKPVFKQWFKDKTGMDYKTLYLN